MNITNYSSSVARNIDDYGVVALMYHRFEENKYPSTNIRIADFRKQLELIEKQNISFLKANEMEDAIKLEKNKRKVLLTIDDAFLSFYENAWPVLKQKKIPFILFVSTKEVGNFNYMNWEQIKEISNENFVHIGNHSDSHGYLVDKSPEEIKIDIEKSIQIFKKKIGYESKFFSYPFGEYSLPFKKIVKDLGFKYAFGQHSGVIDETKNYLELPRFPINEKYGTLKRFETLLRTLPFKYKKIIPEERYINNKTNPPKVIIEFYDNIKNLKLINCYSNEENIWRKSEVNFLDENKIEIKINGKFITERGRINCSLRENNAFWRWLGLQFTVAEK